MRIDGKGRHLFDRLRASDQIADPESDVEVGILQAESLQRNPHHMAVGNTRRIAYHYRIITGN